MDPLNALAIFVLGKMKQSAMALWFKLLFTMSFSAVAAFLFMFGTTLIGTKDWALSVGLGCISSAVCMVALFRQSKLTKGLQVVLPAGEAEREIHADLQTINKTGEL